MTFKNITDRAVLNAAGRLVDPGKQINMPVEYYASHKAFVDDYVDAEKAEIGGLEEYDKYISGGASKEDEQKGDLLSEVQNEEAAKEAAAKKAAAKEAEAKEAEAAAEAAKAAEEVAAKEAEAAAEAAKEAAAKAKEAEAKAAEETADKDAGEDDKQGAGENDSKDASEDAEKKAAAPKTRTTRKRRTAAQIAAEAKK